MADLRNYQGAAYKTGEMIDQGLRSYMLKVYNLMALGLAITGVAAYLGFTFRRPGQSTDAVWRTALPVAAPLGGHPCPAGRRVLPELPD